MIECRAVAARLLDCGVIRTPAGDRPAVRLAAIAAEVAQIAARHKPGAACVERVFSNRNPKTSLAVGEARGAVIAVLARADIAIAEVTALQVKQNLTGAGRADKRQVAWMVRRLLDLPADRQLAPDAADALACALGYARQLPDLAAAGRRRARTVNAAPSPLAASKIEQARRQAARAAAASRIRLSEKLAKAAGAADAGAVGDWMKMKPVKTGAPLGSSRAAAGMDGRAVPVLRGRGRGGVLSQIKAAQKRRR